MKKIRFTSQVRTSTFFQSHMELGDDRKSNSSSGWKKEWKNLSSFYTFVVGFHCSRGRIVSERNSILGFFLVLFFFSRHSFREERRTNCSAFLNYLTHLKCIDFFVHLSRLVIYIRGPSASHGHHSAALGIICCCTFFPIRKWCKCAECIASFRKKRRRRSELAEV